jgi:hypothetical protein
LRGALKESIEFVGLSTVSTTIANASERKSDNFGGDNEASPTFVKG